MVMYDRKLLLVKRHSYRTRVMGQFGILVVFHGNSRFWVKQRFSAAAKAE
jgi:hypothetical protein